MKLEMILSSLTAELALESRRIKSLQQDILDAGNRDPEVPGYSLISNSLHMQLHFAMGRKNGIVTAIETINRTKDGVEK